MWGPSRSHHSKASQKGNGDTLRACARSCLQKMKYILFSLNELSPTRRKGHAYTQHGTTRYKTTMARGLESWWFRSGWVRLGWYTSSGRGDYQEERARTISRESPSPEATPSPPLPRDSRVIHRHIREWSFCTRAMQEGGSCFWRFSSERV